MGGITSKFVDEVIVVPQTPDNDKSSKRSHFLGTDPRSPSDYITRTPIAVNTPDRGSEGIPCDRNIIKTLAVDPRSPSTQVNRTPIQVETKEARSRPIALRPTRLLQLDSVFSSSSEASSTSDLPDPRSPTSKVPRTPLEEKEHVFTDSKVEKGNTDDTEKDSEKGTENMKEVTADPNKQIEKKALVSDNITDKVRQSLSSVQNTGIGNSTPRGILQAKQCRNVEEEYNKSHQTIISQLKTEENKVISNTDFVETI